MTYFQFSCLGLVGYAPVGSLLGFFFFNFVLLSFSTFVAMPDEFDYYCTVVCLEVWKCDSSGFMFICQDNFGYPRYLAFSGDYLVSSFLFLRRLLLRFGLGSH